MIRPAPPASVRRLAHTSLTLVLVTLVGCSTLRSDGPPANPPPDLIRVPDADPRLEPIRDGGPNKPYQALGHLYVPLREDKPFNERGLASWYGRKFHGRRTASGEPYDMYAMTAAHPTLPIPSYARVRNPSNGREVVVRINDRGPFHSDRILDLSYTAALKLGVLNGVQPVELTRITFEDIRTGAWRRPGSVDVAMNPPTVMPSTVVAPLTGGSLTSGGSPIVADDSSLSVLPISAVASPPVTDPTSTPTPVAAVAMAETSAPAASSGAPTPAAVGPGGFWVQLGAFKQRAGAETFHRRVAADLAWLGPQLTVASDGDLFRLQAGPYADREQAQGVSSRVKDSLRLVPVIVDKR